MVSLSIIINYKTLKKHEKKGMENSTQNRDAPHHFLHFLDPLPSIILHPNHINIQ